MFRPMAYSRLRSVSAFHFPMKVIPAASKSLLNGHNVADGRRYLAGTGRTRHFKDSIVLRATGGKGGDGCTSFEGRSLNKESPDGGHGGRGGDVILVAKENFNDFSHFNSFHLKGRDGKNGSGQGKTGRRGEDLELPVPVGTVIYKGGLSRRERQEMLADEEGYDEDGSPTEDDRESRLLADLGEPGDKFTIATGGFPGKGNIMLSTVSYHDAKPLSAFQRSGKPGTNAVIELRLKSIADACLVGYPNAGKSSLLGALSHSRPKVAAYPFTTLHPHIGLVEFSDAKRISLADLPGLVDGASENRGMGHQFLQHVERCKVLVFVLDGAPETYERREMSTVAEDLSNLVNELDLYMEGLSTRPSLVVINKMDRPAATEVVAMEMDAIKEAAPESCEGRIFTVSARDGRGLEDFVVALRQVVERVQKEEAEQSPEERVRRDKYRPLQRIGKAIAGRRALLYRIKRREATHGEQTVVYRGKKKKPYSKTRGER